MSNTIQSYLQTFGENSEYLLWILERYQLNAGNHNEPFTLLLQKNNLPETFLRNLGTAFENPDNFDAKQYKTISIPVILEYLIKTHEYFLVYYFSKIERSIDILFDIYPEAEKMLSLLKIFFTDYRDDIYQHITKEEEQLFPYVNKLICLPSEELKKNKERNKYSIADFKKQHNDENENVLLQMIHMIRQQYPAAGFSPLNILLMQVEQFEKDLRIHSKIEEEVLIPKVEKLERLIFR